MIGLRIFRRKHLTNYFSMDTKTTDEEGLFKVLQLGKKKSSRFSDGPGTESPIIPEIHEAPKKHLRPLAKEFKPSLYDDIVREIRAQINYRPFFVNKQIYDKVKDRIEEAKKCLKESGEGTGKDMVEEMADCKIVLSEKAVGNRSESNAMFIRHALSKINYFYEKCDDLQSRVEKQHMRYNLFECDDSFLDCGLHQWGVAQCKEASKLIDSVEFSAVFVSPLHRTLSTCIEIFKNHPNKEKIDFYVHCDLAEMLKKDSDVFDITKFNATIQEAKEVGIVFDTKKYFHPNWQIQNLTEGYKLEKILHLTQPLELTAIQIKQILLDVFPQPLENYSYFTRRNKYAFQDIKEIQASRGGVVGIISHSLVQKNIFEMIEGFDSKQNFGNLQPVFVKI